MLDDTHADAVASTFGLPAATGFHGPVARGKIGEIWRLDTAGGAYAVKQWGEPPSPEEVALDAAYQHTVRAHGIPAPDVVRTRGGDVLGVVAGVVVRVYSWVDVAPEDRRLPPDQVGTLLAAIHGVPVEAAGPVDDWYVAPVGRPAWLELVGRLTAAGCPFADRMAAAVDGLVAVEALLTAPAQPRMCHRDLWADNLRARTDGPGLVALDWENCGPADPGQELGVLLFEFGCGEAARIRELHDAYVAAGGTGRIRRPGDLTMLLAQQGHIVRIGCERWLAATTDEDRADNADWVAEFLDDPVTVATVDDLLDAVR